MEPDVIVIGAGVAGLASAVELAREGWNVEIIEARDRLGGRVLSTKPRGWNRAVELGAEFVHGGDGRIRKFFGEVGTRLEAVNAEMWENKGGVLSESPDFWERIGRVAGKIPRLNHGWSFERFLREKAEKISPADRELVRAYVSSFNAAPANNISAHALRHQRAGADTDDFKPSRRYDSLIDALRRQLPRRHVNIRLSTVVRSIRWSVGKVAVQCRDDHKRAVTLRARAVVCTLPLGVLKAGTVKFAPRIAARDKAVRRAGWGTVVRVVVRFRRGFWKSSVMPMVLGAHDGREFGFVNAPAERIPVWWALEPPNAVLTGWAGGPAAEPLAGMSPSALRVVAAESLAGIFRTSRAQVERWIADIATHDWRYDPFTRGGYSYPVAGHEDIAQRLAEPVKSTLFFAGEACAAEFGTVHGALGSGVHAARQAGAALGVAYMGTPTSVAPLPLGF